MVLARQAVGRALLGVLLGVAGGAVVLLPGDGAPPVAADPVAIAEPAAPAATAPAAVAAGPPRTASRMLADAVVAQVQAVAQQHYTRPPRGGYRSFTLAATGDLLIHSQVRGAAARPDGGFDFTPQLAAAAADIAGADLGVCHLEVPLDPDGPYSSYPLFNAPAELADAIAATGWDACSTASNHSADQGFPGVVATLDALDAAGVAHSGMYRTPEEAAEARLLEVRGVQVGLVSATYGLNGLPAPGGHEWSVQRIDVPALLDRAIRLREAGAEVVVMALHWGAEYQHAPTRDQQVVAAQLLGSPHVDAIIGHHAHVVQPVAWVGGKPVVYGLGNFLSGQRQEPTRRDGAVVVLEFAEGPRGWRVDAVHAQPTYVDDRWAVVPAHPGDGPVLDASASRTLGHLGVPLSPDPPAPRHDAGHYAR